MKQIPNIKLFVFLLTGLSLVLGAQGASAQQKSLKDQLVGTWSLISNDNVSPNRQRRQLFGAAPKGLVILQDNGQFAQIYLRPDRPKFKTNSRLQGTPDEIKVAWDGTVALFGTWTVDNATQTIAVRMLGHSFPNSEGRESKRTITRLTADELAWFIVAPAAGGRSESVFKRRK
jgi:hypothetical protein